MLFCYWTKNYLVVEALNILSKNHDKWLRIAKSFGLEAEAEDLVQDMYLKVYDWKGKYDKTLMYNDKEANHYFVFLVLRNLYIDKCRTDKKNKKIEEMFSEPNTKGNVFEYKEQLDIIEKEIASWHLYDRKIYELIYIEGYSMLELSKQTGIDYYSIYRTKNKIEKLLNQKLQK